VWPGPGITDAKVNPREEETPEEEADALSDEEGGTVPLSLTLALSLAHASFADASVDNALVTVLKENR